MSSLFQKWVNTKDRALISARDLLSFVASLQLLGLVAVKMSSRESQLSQVSLHLSSSLSAVCMCPDYASLELVVHHKLALLSRIGLYTLMHL